MDSLKDWNFVWWMSGIFVYQWHSPDECFYTRMVTTYICYINMYQISRKLEKLLDRRTTVGRLKERLEGEDYIECWWAWGWLKVSQGSNVLIPELNLNLACTFFQPFERRNSSCIADGVKILHSGSFRFLFLFHSTPCRFIKVIMRNVQRKRTPRIRHGTIQPGRDDQTRFFFFFYSIQVASDK